MNLLLIGGGRQPLQHHVMQHANRFLQRRAASVSQQQQKWNKLLQTPILLSNSNQSRGLSSLATFCCTNPNANHSHAGKTDNPRHYHQLQSSSWHELSIRQPTSMIRKMRHFSSTTKELPVKILYASQGGTAQIFAMQLSEALEEVPGNESRQVTVQGLHEEPPSTVLQPGQAFYIVLASTAGVGEPPDNARQFMEYLMSDTAVRLDGLDFCVFGLGNQKAHPNHFNMMGKGLDQRLEELGARRVYQLGLGDDGDCIEDDYDSWMEGLVQSIYYGADADEDAAAVPSTETKDSVDTTKEMPDEETSTSSVLVEDPNVTLQSCEGAKTPNGKRLVSSKFGRLRLTPSGTDVIRDDLLHLNSSPSTSPFYMENTQALPVRSNRPLCPQAGENGMFEMRVSLRDTSNMTYETGDHLMVYPQNSQAMVEGFLQHLDVDPHATIDAPDESTLDDHHRRHPYPHPTGITLAETLRHCVDLSAVPPPNFARLLLGRPKIDYKDEIANPRRTVLDLMVEASRPFALEEILYNLPPMKPRYYSIASSSLVHPEDVYLVYRPVQYTSTKGHLRFGVSTSFMKNMMGTEDDNLDEYNTPSDKAESSSLIAVVNPNPSFRLPENPKIPVLFIAGGCGIAPIRAFLEERIYLSTKHSHNPHGEGYLFLGFRSPGDAPYKKMIAHAFRCGAISNIHLTYGTGCGKGANTALFGENDIRAHTSCGLVTDAVGDSGEQLYSFFEHGGYTYICGGARHFGVAIENKIHSLFQKEGNLSEVQATQYLRRLLDEGRLKEDLSD